MRTEKEMYKLILDVAENDERVRAVLLNGSRADPSAVKDKLQDFDIVYIVRDYNSFISDHNWIDIFGERLILQMPDEMSIGLKDETAFHYLMLFNDNSRIDLTLYPLDNISNFVHDVFTKILLDKDSLFSDFKPTPNIYIIKPPSENEFRDCCNEFWWVSTYVAKGLMRDEIIYAKDMLEGPVRSMFLKMIDWYIGTLTGFSVSTDKSSRYIKKYIPSSLYDKILATYPDSVPDNIWSSLFLMTELFSTLTKRTSDSLNIKYNSEEENNVKEYLQWLRS